MESRPIAMGRTPGKDIEKDGLQCHLVPISWLCTGLLGLYAAQQ